MQGGGEGGVRTCCFFCFVFAKESPRKARRTGSWAGVCLCGFGLESGFGAGVRGLIFNGWLWVVTRGSNVGSGLGLRI